MSQEMKWMKEALKEAKKAQEKDEVPIGAVLISPEGKRLARAHNLVEKKKDPTAHAELLCIKKACQKQKAKRLPGCVLYVTLEPCAMCATAASFARIESIYYAASDPKGGGIEHGGKIYTHQTCHHKPKVRSGLCAEESAKILKDFFKKKR